MSMYGFIWLAAVIVFMVLEAITYQMVSVWFIIGAVGGLITAMCGADFWIQMVVFLALSLILLVCFRPFAVKKLKTTKLKTNAESAIGKKVVITEKVDNVEGIGQGKLDGQIWTVRTESGAVLNVGDVAEVKRIDGVKLIVE